MNDINCVLCAGSPEIDVPKLFINGKDRTIDICIYNEIRHLINNEITTYGCCCGHGRLKPSCLVSIESKNKLNQLGYDLHKFSKNQYIIYLKTNIQKELRTLLENKAWKYKKENDLE